MSRTLCLLSITSHFYYYCGGVGESCLFKYDCVTFYSQLETMRLTKFNSYSMWLVTDAASTLFQAAKDRVFSVSCVGVKRAMTPTSSTTEEPALKSARKESVSVASSSSSTAATVQTINERQRVSEEVVVDGSYVWIIQAHHMTHPRRYSNGAACCS